MNALNGTDPKFAGLIIPSHYVKDTATKKRAEKSLYDYQLVSYTAPEWIEQLENGRTIIPGAFSPKPDGKYTHAEGHWVSTHFILCDADHIKGIEFDEDGNDKFPNGVEPWTKDGQLSIKFPGLLKDAYAVGQSVSSMGDRFIKAHRRYRIIFHFDKPITCGKHYRQIELALAEKYPIIPPIARQPAQPTFGNAREGYNKYYITGNILKLDDFPYIDPEPKASSSKGKHKHTEQKFSLREYLEKKGISYTVDSKGDPRYPDRLFVKCPEAHRHTDGICKPKDSFLWNDGNGFAFYCSHASCGQNTWAQFKAGYGIGSTHGSSLNGAGRKSNIDKAKEAKPIEKEQKDFDDPTFPTASAFQHGFQHFADAFNGIDWICPAYNFAAALSQASMALGRKFRVKELGMQHPNFYQMIIGRSHLAAKSPTLARAINGVEHIRRFDCFDDCREQINIIDQINSAESFRREFETHDPHKDLAPYDWYSISNGVRGFIPYDEVATFLSKTRQTATEGISSEITRLYNPSNRPIVNNAAASLTHGEDWVLNFLGCSTIEWYEKFLTQGDFASGFLNRFVFYLHDQMPFKARFDDVNGKALNQWYGLLETTAETSLKYQAPTTYHFTDDAYKHFEKWFKEIFDMLVADDDIKNQASIRVATHAIKLSLVYAVLDPETDKQVVTPAHFDSALNVAEYWAKCSGLTLDLIAFDRRSKAEEIVLKASYRIQGKGEKVRKRSLRRSINSKTMSSDELNKTVDALSQMQILLWDNNTETYVVSEDDVPGLK